MVQITDGFRGACQLWYCQSQSALDVVDVPLAKEAPFHILYETLSFGSAPLTVPIIGFDYCNASALHYYVLRVSPSYIVDPDTSCRASGSV